jgi:hypothetical protein
MSCVKCGGVVVGDKLEYWAILNGAEVRVTRRGQVCQACFAKWLRDVAVNVESGGMMTETNSALSGVVMTA